MISVVVATYSRAGLLPRAIGSLLAQKHADWELVVIDDGSVDDSAGGVARLAAGDERIRYFYQENQGLTSARNAGLTQSRGELVTFLDSDDEYLPDHLSLRAEYMESHPEVDMIHGGVQIVGGDAYVCDVLRPGQKIHLADCCIGGTFFLRSRVWRKLGGFRHPDYGNDFEFMQRAESLFTVGRVDYPTYVYHRETPDSMCNVMEKSCR